MRITNKIISNNSVTNINRNKVLEDKINTQLSTGSKISRPSDDPVVAIRALRLRTNLSQVNQYYKKNVPDAESWLDITESAITKVVDIVSDFYKKVICILKKFGIFCHFCVLFQIIKCTKQYTTGRYNN